MHDTTERDSHSFSVNVGYCTFDKVRKNEGRNQTRMNLIGLPDIHTIRITYEILLNKYKNKGATYISKSPFCTNVSTKPVCINVQIANMLTELFLIPWGLHQMKTFSALVAFCAGNSPVTYEFPTQRPVTRSFDVFSHLCLNKRLSKQSWGWWFETPSRSLWRHCNAKEHHPIKITYN